MIHYTDERFIRAKSKPTFTTSKPLPERLDLSEICKRHQEYNEINQNPKTNNNNWIGKENLPTNFQLIPFNGDDNDDCLVEYLRENPLDILDVSATTDIGSSNTMSMTMNTKHMLTTNYPNYVLVPF